MKARRQAGLFASGFAPGFALAVVGLVVALAGSARAATPKVCGNDAALGSFDPASCPVLKDDGIAPDEAAGDGIYTVEVVLAPKPLLEYKLLPSGTFDGTQLGQSGTCDVTGSRGNTYGNIQVPEPDTSRPVRFFYDSRTLSDPSYASPPGNRSGGDDLMQRSPAASCPQWLAVGDFQNVPFDRAVGAVELTLQRPGVLAGRLTATRALASGWRWKIVEGRAAAGFRKYGPSGWADDPCDTDNVSVASPVRPGDIVYFTWYSASGRLRTAVVAPGEEADGGVYGGLPLCPPASPVDLGDAADLAAAAPADGSAAPSDAAGIDVGDGGPARPRPGIHCDCQLGGSAPAPLGSLAMAMMWAVSAAGYLIAHSRCARRPPRNQTGQ